MAKPSQLKRRFFWSAIFLVGLVLSIFSVVNRAPVDIDLWPLPLAVAVPVFALALGMCALGMIAGATLFWLQMLRWRLRAKRLERRLSELETPVVSLPELASVQSVTPIAATSDETRSLSVP
jgi:uncharacterized integral membrane protein